MHALIFGFCWFRYRLPDVGTNSSSSSAYRAVPPPLEFPFVLALLKVTLNSLSSGFDKIDASQLSRTVEVGFLDSPLLLLFSLSRF